MEGNCGSIEGSDLLCLFGGSLGCDGNPFYPPSIFEMQCMYYQVLGFITKLLF